MREDSRGPEVVVEVSLIWVSTYSGFIWHGSHLKELCTSVGHLLFLVKLYLLHGGTKRPQKICLQTTIILPLGRAISPSHSWQVGAAQLLSNSHVTKMVFWMIFPIFQLFTPSKSFVMSTQTDKAGGGRSLWHFPLCPCCSSHTGRVWDWPRRPRALRQASVPATHAAHEGSLLCSCSSQAGGKRFTGADTVQEAAVPDVETMTPVNLCDPSCPPPGLRGTMCTTTGSSGALPAWLLAVQFVHITPDLLRHKGGNIDTERRLPFVCFSRNLG